MNIDVNNLALAIVAGVLSLGLTAAITALLLTGNKPPEQFVTLLGTLVGVVIGAAAKSAR